MVRRAPPLAAGLALLVFASASTRASIVVDSSDSRCIALAGAFPPGLDWIDAKTGIALVANFEPGFVVPVDFAQQPPKRVGSGPLSDLRVAIGTAACNGTRSPQIDGVSVASAELAFLTASSCEGVAFVSPATGALRSAAVSTPASFAADTFPNLPPPGSGAQQVAVSTRLCVSVPPGTLDSRGTPVPALPGNCSPGEPSYFTSFTSGAAVAAGRLFVTTSNLGAGAGTLAPQFLPGTVLVFDLSEDPLAVSPHPVTPLIATTAFNPTDVTPYTTPSGRALLLIGGTGALGLVTDDPRTSEREAGGRALTDAAIDVIDPAQLRLIASIPLGPAALSFGRLAIDPSGRVALIGSAIARHVFAVDLAPLEVLEPGAPFAWLDGVDGPRAAIFDAGSPLEIPALPNGAPPSTCPGFIVGVDFGADGRVAYATDFCDGTISPIAVTLAGAGPGLLAASRFRVLDPIPVVAPVGPGSLGLAQAPGDLRVRTVEGEDEAAVLVGSPEGLACSIALSVPEPNATATALLAGLALTALRAAKRSSPTTEGDTP